MTTVENKPPMSYWVVGGLMCLSGVFVLCSGKQPGLGMFLIAIVVGRVAYYAATGK